VALELEPFGTIRSRVPEMHAIAHASQPAKARLEKVQGGR
jgi:hypothetical protein